MKRKLFVIITTIFCCFALSFSFACSCTAASLNFNDNYTSTGTGSALDSYTETATYSVVYKMNEKATSSIVEELYGTYVTEFSHISLADLKRVMDPDGTNTENYESATKDYTGSVYRLKTTQTMSGANKLDETAERAEVADVIESTVYFKNMDNEFKPMYAVKNYKSTTPVNTSAVKVLIYSVKTTYYKKNAVSVIETSDENTLSLFRANGMIKKDATSGTRTVKKVSSAFDNDQLLFVVRSLLTSKFSSSLTLLEPTEGAKKTVSVKVNTDSASQQCKAYTDAEGKEISFACYKTTITLSYNSYSGTSKTAYFINKEQNATESQQKTYGNILIKYIDPIVYLNGNLEYTLTKYVRS